MDKEQIEKRLGATKRQINLFERLIEDASKQKGKMHPKVYKAMVVGYESERDKLKEEARQYEEELKSFNQ